MSHMNLTSTEFIRLAEMVRPDLRTHDLYPGSKILIRSNQQTLAVLTFKDAQDRKIIQFYAAAPYLVCAHAENFRDDSTAVLTRVVEQFRPKLTAISTVAKGTVTLGDVVTSYPEQRLDGRNDGIVRQIARFHLESEYPTITRLALYIAMLEIMKEIGPTLGK